MSIPVCPSCGRLLETQHIRWSPQRKEMLILRARINEDRRAAVLLIFQLSAEELDGWMERYDAHGVVGLSVKNLQKVGAR